VLRLDASRPAALLNLIAVLIQFVKKIIMSGHRVTAEWAKFFGHG
jgi:hypothetical protein